MDFNSFRSIYGDLIISCVSMLNAKIKVFNRKIQKGEDQFLLDGFPYDSGHLISVHFYDRIGNLYLWLHGMMYI